LTYESQLRSALIDALILLRSIEADIRDASAEGRIPRDFCNQPGHRDGRRRVLQLNGLLGDPELATFAAPLERDGPAAGSGVGPLTTA
jgi:hypothetical protein